VIETEHDGSQPSVAERDGETRLRAPAAVASEWGELWVHVLDRSTGNKRSP
jgi:hypothetical protein